LYSNVEITEGNALSPAADTESLAVAGGPSGANSTAATEISTSVAKSVVLVTSQGLEEQYFAMKLAQAFPDQLIAWLAVGPRRDGARRPFFERTWLGRREKTYLDREVSRFNPELHAPLAQVEAESSLASAVRALNPTFIASFGMRGDRALWSSAGAFALRLKIGARGDQGELPIARALARGSLDEIQCAVVAYAPGRRGPVLVGKSAPTLAIDDSSQSCFRRCVVVGTELMRKALAAAIETNELVVSASRTCAPTEGEAPGAPEEPQVQPHARRRGLLQRRLSDRINF
jgi:hypothetical protein